MDKQVLVKFSENLRKEIQKENYINMKFEKQNNEIVFIFNNETYKTELVNLKTVLESYSLKDKINFKEVHKTNTISQILLVDNPSFKSVSEPLQFLNYNDIKFKKINKKEKILEEILERDRKAENVEYELIEESDEFIKEIESELMKSQKEKSKNIKKVGSEEEKNKIEEKIIEKRKLMEEAPNEIIKKRFQKDIDELTNEFNKL